MNARTRRVAASCAQLSRWLPAASCPAASCADGFFCLASVLQTLAAYRAQARPGPPRTAIRAPIKRWTWFLINFNTHKHRRRTSGRGKGAGPHCYTVLTKSTPYEQSTPSRMGGATDVVHRRCGRRPCEEMDDRVVEELRAFISQRYSSFMTSTLTFRHLKQHLSDTLGLPYGMFSLPDGRYADTLDDEVDAIAVRCDGGARDVECVSQPGYVPREPRLRVHHVAGYGVLVLLAVALFRKRPRRRSVDKDK